MSKEIHEHMCQDCVRLWEHDDKTCSHRKMFICDICAAQRRAERDRGEAWAEMARNMPIPHSHICIICRKEWEHNDKKCALQEIIYLECEACMTFTFTHLCPKCGTESEEVAYSAPYHVTRCVCPKCRHYFAPPGQQIYAAPEHTCPECGKEAKKVESALGSIHYVCSDCQYSFYTRHVENKDAGMLPKDTSPNSICPRCEKPFISTENDLGMCPECEYWFRLHNPGHGKEESDMCPRCGTRVVSDVCAKCGYNILLDRDNTDGYDAGVG